MTERVTPRRHGSYGIDAPYAPAFIALMTVVVLVMAIISGRDRDVMLERSGLSEAAQLRLATFNGVLLELTVNRQTGAVKQWKPATPD